MSRDTYPLKLPHSIKKAAPRLAKEDGVSLNQWIAAAVAEKIGGVELGEEGQRGRIDEVPAKTRRMFLRKRKMKCAKTVILSERKQLLRFP